MDNIIDITQILFFKRAVRILEILDLDYDYEKLKSKPELCKNIVDLFEDDATLLKEYKWR